ncbi:MAG: TspO/MBR family protein [Halioglobus sp.]
MQRSILNRYGVVAALVLVVAVNWLANWLPLGGFTTGEVSALYESLFTPAGFTFAIWGVIYTGLLIYAVYQVTPGQSDNALLQAVGRLFIINCLLNCLWLFTWHFQMITASLAVMATILINLLLIYRLLHRQDEQVSAIVALPFSIYLAWICVAAIANFSALQTAMNLNDAGLTAIEWTLVKMAVAGCIGAVAVLLWRDIAFIVVVGWAAYGISVKQAATPEVYGAAMLIVLLAAALIATAGVRRIIP